MDRKYLIQVTEGGPTGYLVWKCVLFNTQFKDIEKRHLQHTKRTISETSDLHKAIQIEREDSEDDETRGKSEIRFLTKEFTDQETTSDREILDN
ncbi:hypothetical protein PPACK8108_LOCUS20196 [Phakopsora pachyrhizi]|uniref:Uncharacterized protein n=1 Tax=Phakopsora pachyrhizi TaxID=170000 RepID=A0AAV0BHP1_PHAPC|nr:hypothetical protein PPACK8108_LOCUS20196 [Phakopsora pachyrhizi]